MFMIFAAFLYGPIGVGIYRLRGSLSSLVVLGLLGVAVHFIGRRLAPATTGSSAGGAATAILVASIMMIPIAFLMYLLWIISGS